MMQKYIWMDQLLGSEKQTMTEKQICIIQAAIELFSEKGYASTSTKEIAQKADVAEGTIFKHYKTKQELMLSICKMMVHNMAFSLLSTGLDELFEQPYETLEDFMKAFMANRLGLVQHAIPMFKLLIQEMPFQPEIRELFNGNIENLPLMNGLERLRKQGLIVDVPTRELSKLLLSSFFGFTSTRFILLPEYFAGDMEEDLKQFIGFMVRGLSPQHKNK